MKEKQSTSVLCEVNTTRKCFVAGEPSTVGAFVWLIALHRTWFAGHFAATLAALITVLLLGGGYQPQAAACLAQDRGTEQPLIESNLFFNPH